MQIAMTAKASRTRVRIVNIALICGILILILFAAALKLHYPLRNDQALFLLYAMEIDQGSKLYADMWDIKQPMIFLFYYISGSLFGFTDTGVHIGELVWNIFLCILVFILGRRHFGSRWIALIAPFFVLIYYVYVSPSEQTQVEALVTLPILLAALLAIRALDEQASTRLMAFLAGVCAGIASAFKIPFALIGCGIHAYVLFRAWRTGTAAAAVLHRLAVPWLLGAAAVWLLLLGYFVTTGSAAEFLHTTFLYPLQSAVEFEQAPISRLLLGGAQIVVTLAPWLCLLAGFLLPPRIKERVPLPPLLLIWISIATLVILVQRFSWWPYQWWQLLAPMFLLCMLGLDRIVGAASKAAWLGQGHRWLLPVLLLAPFTAVLNQLGQNAYVIANAGGLRSFDGTAFRLEVDRNYRDVLGATNAFPGDCSRDRIYVFGTPAIYTRLDCRYLYTFAGQNLAYIRASQRAELAGKLRAAPPDWIFVAPASAERLQRQEQELQALLDADYRPAVAGDWGTWYRRIERS